MRISSNFSRYHSHYYIGSHTVVELLRSGHEVVGVDDLSNAKIEANDRIKEITGKRLSFYWINYADKEKLWYRNNLDSTMTLYHLVHNARPQ